MRAPSSARGATYGLLAAALFGASAPLAKRLLAEVEPVLLAGLLYLGAGAGVTVYRLVAPAPPVTREARLSRADLGLLLGVVLTGGVLGPVAMLLGLARVSALAGSLLLNLEAPFTILLAVAVFGEHLGRRPLLGAALVVVGGALLAWRPGDLRAEPLGVLAIAGACASWALDNNLSQRLSLRDPLSVVQVKTLGAGAGTTSLALLLGTRAPSPAVFALALAVGSLAYGASILLDLHALRLLGAAREAAYFATAPFLGALLAVSLLGDRLGMTEALAGLAMAAGVVILQGERHTHVHTHEPLEHEHSHTHDEHHQHAHEGPISEPHSHRHRHERVTHAHPHVSDLHHRHKH